MKTDRHSPGYYKRYHLRIKADALEAYGGKCSCEHCVLHRDNLGSKEKKMLRVFLVDKKKIGLGIEQGQFGVAAYLKKIGYEKGAAFILCKMCYLGEHPCRNRQYSKEYMKLRKFFRSQKHYGRKK